MAKSPKGRNTGSAAKNILLLAINREEDAARFYAELADQATPSGAKILLRELQADEVRHKTMLEDLARGRSRMKPLRDVPDIKVSDYLVDEPIAADSPFQDVLIFAAKKEAKAAALYEALLGRASDPAARRLFEYLIQQEKTHKLRLEKEYERYVLEEN